MQLPRYHRLRGAFYRLEGTRCESCDRNYFPPRDNCRQCRARNLPSLNLQGSGTLYSFSRMSSAPRGFANQGPYAVGMVQLDDGPLIMAQLTDVEGVELEIGMPVQMVTRKLRDSSDHGYIVYGYKFRPLVAPVSDVATATAADAAAAAI